MTARIALFAAALASAAALPRPARADEVPDKARALADRGRALHDAGDYKGAIRAFEEAYVLAPSPALLFNLAQAHRLEGHCADAAMLYRRYLAANPSTEGKTIAQGHLASVEHCLSDVPQPVDPYPFAAAMAGTPNAAGGPADTTSPPLRARVEKDVGIGLGVAGVLALSIAVYEGVEAHDAAASVERGYAHGGRWEDLAAADARGRHAQTMARVWGISGGVAIAGGVALYLLGRHTERVAPIVVAPARGGATVGAAWSF